jgi:metallo-beta-lactamase family protein
LQIKLRFLGGAYNVTGSRHLIEVNGTRIMVDCGLYQERDFKERNWVPFLIPPSSIDAMLLTHAHVDHCGLIPKLVKDGFRGKIYCTHATSEIVKIILLDAAHLQEEDAEFKKKRHEREKRKGPFPEVPLYTQEDAKNAFPHFSPVDYEEVVPLGDGIQATFHDAGHVLGSSMIKLTIKQDGETRTVLFSGDIGRENKPILEDPSQFNKIDYIIMESTYGDRTHKESPDINEALAEVINSTWKAGGNIIVPSFALQRTQEILYHMNQLLLEDRIPHLMVFLDSPMAAKITEVFRNHEELFDREMARLLKQGKSPFDFPGFKVTETTDESKALNHIKGTAMIIAGSGMCNGGRIKHHLVSNISRPESTILFVGYQAIGTLGRTIVDGAKQVRILGQNYPVLARIAQIGGFSAHADRDELISWITSLKSAPRRVFIVHGESKAVESFGELLRKKTGWEVSTPEYRTEAILD